MTAGEKTSVAYFIDLASDTVRGGYFRGERTYDWKDAAVEKAAPEPSAGPLVMVVCDAPSSGEEAGLLDKMLGSIGLSNNNNCFITDVANYENTARSRKPRFILCMGEAAAKTLLRSGEPVEKLRGKPAVYKTGDATIPVVATYHPGDLLRNGDLKRRAWDDLKLFRAYWRDVAPEAVAPESAVSGATGGAG